MNLHDLELGSGFLDVTSKAQAAKEKIDNLNFTQIRNFCFKRHHKESKKTKYRMREDICKSNTCKIW